MPTEEALFFAGTSRVGKIRITYGDFTIVDEVYIPGHERESISTAEIRRVVKDNRRAPLPLSAADNPTA